MQPLVHLLHSFSLSFAGARAAVWSDSGGGAADCKGQSHYANLPFKGEILNKKIPFATLRHLTA
jgi:hypothetical protein